ncbi:hypothetical protein Cadr_000018591 [Camelus dromedarius]|uniref:Uncharacterized protein n=1 Tax=Camelus dromedarius TaxID=9838 RepID=A0A5N4D1X1_CAMDR|nr:hypothetical protein Cadr_000018591 [Camelus dromedarius]
MEAPLGRQRFPVYVYATELRLTHPRLSQMIFLQVPLATSLLLTQPTNPAASPPPNTQLAQSSQGRSSPDLQQPNFHISISWKTSLPGLLGWKQEAPGLQKQQLTRFLSLLNLKKGTRKAEEHLSLSHAHREHPVIPRVPPPKDFRNFRSHSVCNHELCNGRTVRPPNCHPDNKQPAGLAQQVLTPGQATFQVLNLGLGKLGRGGGAGRGLRHAWIKPADGARAGGQPGAADQQAVRPAAARPYTGRQARGSGAQAVPLFRSRSSVRLPQTAGSAALWRLRPPPERARPLAPELIQATSSRFLGAATMCSRGPARGALGGRAPHCPRPEERPPPSRLLGARGPGSGAPREGVAPVCMHAEDGCPGLSAPALASYLQQLHVARWEPAAEPVLLLAFPPAAVRDLQQRDELARGEAQPLAMPLPREGVQGPAAGAGHGLGARVHSAACIPAEPSGLGSGSAGSQAPGAPGSRALGARRLGGARGPGRAGDAHPAQRSEDSRASESERRRPRARRLTAPSLGRGSGGGDPGTAGSGEPTSRDAERGQPPRGPTGARAALARGNAQLPAEVGPGASPSARLRGEGVAADVERGLAAGRGSLGARGRGGGWTRAATPAEGRALRVSRLTTPPPPRAAGIETPVSACFVGLVARGGRAPPLRCLRVAACYTGGTERGGDGNWKQVDGHQRRREGRRKRKYSPSFPPPPLPPTRLGSETKEDQTPLPQSKGVSTPFALVPGWLQQKVWK